MAEPASPAVSTAPAHTDATESRPRLLNRSVLPIMGTEYASHVGLTEDSGDPSGSNDAVRLVSSSARCRD
jgi:hypothetical protein